jgi:hypothetical protein
MRGFRGLVLIVMLVASVEPTVCNITCDGGQATSASHTEEGPSRACHAPKPPDGVAHITGIEHCTHDEPGTASLLPASHKRVSPPDLPLARLYDPSWIVSLAATRATLVITYACRSSPLGAPLRI